MAAAPRILVLFGNVPLWGQERANIETLHALKESGAEVLFAIRSEWTQESIQPELSRRGLPFVCVRYYDAIRHGVSLHVWLRNIVGVLAGSWELLWLIRRFQPTHLHAGSTANVLNFIPALAVTRIPLVLRAGDLPPLHHALWRWVWRFTCRRASRVVCDTRFVQDRLISLGLDSAKTRVIYQPAPRRTGRGDPVADLRRSAELTFLYVGQISQEKGIHLLLEAALELCRERDDLRFLIAGDYSRNNALGERLVAEVERAGMTERIRFLGFVEDIDAVYRVADVHVCPSLCDEAYGLTVVEAKTRAMPSVVFASGGLVEIVTHQVDGYVCSEKTSACLEQAFTRYADDKAAVQVQGRAALDSLKRLDVESFADAWKSVYASV